jgi:hypothetical protein
MYTAVPGMAGTPAAHRRTADGRTHRQVADRRTHRWRWALVCSYSTNGHTYINAYARGGYGGSPNGEVGKMLVPVFQGGPPEYYKDISITTPIVPALKNYHI